MSRTPCYLRHMTLGHLNIKIIIVTIHNKSDGVGWSSLESNDPNDIYRVLV
jgi:hypothetical protein